MKRILLPISLLPCLCRAGTIGADLLIVSADESGCAAAGQPKASLAD